MRARLAILAGVSASIAFCGIASAAESLQSEYARGMKEYAVGVAQAHELSTYSYGELSDCSLAMHLTANRMLKSSSNAENGARMMAVSGAFNAAAHLSLAKNEIDTEIPFLLSLRDWIISQEGNFDAVLVAQMKKCEAMLAATSGDAKEKVLGVQN